MQEVKSIYTKYGVLKGISYIEFYKNGIAKECTLNELNELKLPFGVLVPQYEDDGIRRKYTRSISFHQNGNIKSISLNEQTSIQTPEGVFPAELITFYEDGNIKRLFPLNGKITGYWTEQNEYELAKPFEFIFSFGSFKVKMISINFYENGSVKSFTFWPNDSINIATPVGQADVRIGISLYDDGKLKSFEPKKPMVLDTPIGVIEAFDANALGIHGENNSLRLYENGSVRSLISSTDIIEVINELGEKTVYTPLFKLNMLDDEKMDIIPIYIEFHDDCARINGNDYDINRNIFSIKRHLKMFSENSCSDCSSCEGCGSGLFSIIK